MTQLSENTDRPAAAGTKGRAGHSAAPTGGGAADFRDSPLRFWVFLAVVGPAAAIVPQLARQTDAALVDGSVWRTAVVLAATPVYADVRVLLPGVNPT